MNPTPPSPASEPPPGVAESRSDGANGWLRVPESAVVSGSVVVIALILGLAAFTLLTHILFPLIVAAFLFFVIRSITDAFIRRGIGRPVMYLTLFALLLVISLLASQVVAANAAQFRKVFPDYRKRLITYVDHWTGQQRAPDAPPSSLSETLNVTLGDAMQFAFGQALGLAEFLLIVFFYLIFLLLNADSLPGRVRRAFPGKTSGRLIEIGNGIRQSIQRYVRMKAMVSLGMAAVAAVIMAPFQLDFWPLWVFLTFALNFITYIGSLAALVPPIGVAFLQFGNPVAAGVLAGLLGLNRFLWIDYIEIRAAGKGLNLDPVLVLLAIMYWGKFGGMLGLLLAVPMLTCVKIVLAHFKSTERWAILMSEK
jgi:AI-2 transport protein TqsA